MRKFILNLLCICFIFSSCSYLLNKPSEITVTNNSSYDVSFYQPLRSNDIFTVPENSKVLIPAVGDCSPKLVITNSKPVCSYSSYEFEVELRDLPGYQITVENNTSQTINFQVLNQPLTDSYTVVSGENKQIIIYTTNPTFNSDYKHFSFDKDLQNLYFY